LALPTFLLLIILFFGKLGGINDLGTFDRSYARDLKKTLNEAGKDY
jgi:hypothetical protein